MVHRPSGTAMRSDLTVGGPYGIHPFGNKGADLIETLRLDALSGGSRQLAQRHPSVNAAGVVERQPPSAWGKPWAETPAKYARPKSAAVRGTMTVHSADFLNEILEEGGAEAAGRSNVQSIDSSQLESNGPTSSRGDYPAGDAAAEASTLSAAAPASPRRARPASAQPSQPTNARELLRLKQEASAERTLRRLRQQQADYARREEKIFHEQCARIEKEEGSFVLAVGEYLKLRRDDRQLRERALHKAWENAVFDKIDSQLQHAVSARFAPGQDPGARWIEAQDRYLEASARKEGNLFRDIIIESEYDPMVFARQGIKYREELVGRDPVKQELLNAAAERGTIPGAFAPPPRSSRGALDPTMWTKIDATPYCERASKSRPHPNALKGAQSQIPMRHFQFPIGKAVLDAEYGKGKRTFGTKR